MKNWKKKTQHTASTLASIILCFLLMMTFSVKAEKMNGEKYIFSFKTHKSTCILRVNNFPAVDSVRADQGTMSAGFNLTAFLEDGSNNIELLMGGVDFEGPKTLFSDSSCEVVISKDTHDSSVKIAEFKLNVNDKGEICAGESMGYKGGEFSSKIVEGFSNSKVDFGLYKAQSDIILSGIPKWSWTKATPVTDNDLPVIRKAYENIISMIKNRDIEGLKKITKISNDEMGGAEGVSPAVMFISTDFPQHVVDKSLMPVPIQWNKYKLVKYRDGKLFRLAVGYYQNSPLKFQNVEGKVVFTYNPYFSIIDGKVTLVR